MKIQKIYVTIKNQYLPEELHSFIEEIYDNKDKVRYFTLAFDSESVYEQFKGKILESNGGVEPNVRY